jgi:hypothetical protein
VHQMYPDKTTGTGDQNRLLLRGVQ